MKLGRFLAAALLATAVASIWASSAGASSHAAPEFGRCVKNAKSEAGGGFANKGCSEAVESGAKYHWVAGPGVKPGFTASASGVDLYVYSGSYGRHATPSVECSTASTVGEYTSADSESLELTLSGCKMASASCQSEAAPAGEIVFDPLEGLLVISEREYWGEALVRWSPALGGTLASFECGGTSVTITGSILHPIVRNRMESSEREQLKVWKEGVQKPSCYELCGPGELPATTIGGVTSEWSGLTMSGTQTNEEAIEADTLLP